MSIQKSEKVILTGNSDLCIIRDSIPFFAVGSYLKTSGRMSKGAVAPRDFKSFSSVQSRVRSVVKRLVSEVVQDTEKKISLSGEPLNLSVKKDSVSVSVSSLGDGHIDYLTVSFSFSTDCDLDPPAVDQSSFLVFSEEKNLKYLTLLCGGDKVLSGLLADRYVFVVRSGEEFVSSASHLYSGCAEAFSRDNPYEGLLSMTLRPDGSLLSSTGVARSSLLFDLFRKEADDLMSYIIDNSLWAALPEPEVRDVKSLARASRRNHLDFSLDNAIPSIGHVQALIGDYDSGLSGNIMAMVDNSFLVMDDASVAAIKVSLCPITYEEGTDSSGNTAITRSVSPGKNRSSAVCSFNAKMSLLQNPSELEKLVEESLMFFNKHLGEHRPL